jgi:hypothetical protein
MRTIELDGQLYRYLEDGEPNQPGDGQLVNGRFVEWGVDVTGEHASLRFFTELRPIDKPEKEEIMKPTDKELKALVEFFQDECGLEVDGIFGPKTKATLAPHVVDVNVQLKAAWEWAIAQEGKGSGNAPNNTGAYIRGLREFCGFPLYKKNKNPIDGPWCAVGASAALKHGGIDIKSRGAYTLCEKLEADDRFEEYTADDLLLDHVYVACWKRKRFARTRAAHVRLLRLNIGGAIEYVGFNEVGDKVAIGPMTMAEMEKDLLMIVGAA